jgi:hypothetical protein
MPRTSIIFYQETANDVPVLDWLQKLRRSGDRAYETCVAAIERLAAFGHELRRPLADILRDGIYETADQEGPRELQNPIFFSRKKSGDPGSRPYEGRRRAEGGDRACARRKKAFEADPDTHSYSEEEQT